LNLYSNGTTLNSPNNFLNTYQIVSSQLVQEYVRTFNENKDIRKMYSPNCLFTFSTESVLIEKISFDVYTSELTKSGITTMSIQQYKYLAQPINEKTIIIGIYCNILINYKSYNCLINLVIKDDNYGIFISNQLINLIF
jgi:hypothetical protein